jgi:hypothetical protein
MIGPTEGVKSVNSDIKRGSSSRWGRIRFTILLLIGYFSVTVLLQKASGAYSSDFGGYPDEPGHYVTGLMVRDYIAGFFPNSPFDFAENYYIHYPKVAFGHWPPAFYVIEAIWMLIFSTSRTSVLLLMSTLTAIIGLLVYREARSHFGVQYGVAAGLLFICLPTVQGLTSMVMAEIPMAVLTFLALLRLARFLDYDRWQDAVWFGLWSAAAILTKGNAWALALTPPLALLLTRDFRRVTSARFWIPAVIVLVLCGPYHILTWRMIHHGWPSDPGGIGSTVRALPELSRYLVQTIGWPLFLFAVLGVYAKVIAPWLKRTMENYWAVMITFIVAFFAFHALLYHDVAELRYYVIIAPAMVLFVMAGAQFLLHTRFLRVFAPAVRLAAVAICIGGSFAAWTFTIPPRPSHGFEKIAQRLASTPASEVLLISSSEYGEGMFIAEIAQYDRRPSHFVLRATQQLTQSSWTGDKYSTLYQTPDEVERVLEEIPVSIVVVDTARPTANVFAHHQLLIDAIRNNAAAWEQIDWYASADGAQTTRDIRVYRFKKATNQQPRRITVDLTNKINKVLKGRF